MACSQREKKKCFGLRYGRGEKRGGEEGIGFRAGRQDSQSQREGKKKKSHFAPKIPNNDL